MIRLSVNVLSSALLFLNKIHDNATIRYDDLLYFPSIMQINVNNLYEFSEALDYVRSENTFIKLTNNGEVLLKLSKDHLFEQCFRKMLYDYIVNARPIWGYKIPSGRKEAFLFMNKDEQACFYEANLMVSPPSDSSIEWWDEMAFFFRTIEKDTKLEIGRKGERLTFDYETRRLGIQPQWISIESNKLGYDIMSKVSKNNNSQLLIEVKASTEPMDSACFYISSNEWSIAKMVNEYMFYLWLIHKNDVLLAKLNYQQIKNHIPNNKADGVWEEVRIPFISFEKEFNTVEGALYE